MSLTGGKRKVNKTLKAWVAFVKKVQKEEKLNYKDAIQRAKQRSDKGEKWKNMKGGENTATIEEPEEIQMEEKEEVKSEGEPMKEEVKSEGKPMEEEEMEGGIILGGKRKSMRRKSMRRTRRRSVRRSRGRSRRRSAGRH